MNKLQPLVSVIIPAYNAALYIEAAIHSVQQQTYTNWELIIVDDESTDNTADIIKKMQLIDRRIIYLAQPNKKQAAARNTGIKIAKGEWIAFLDADDIWLPEKLETQLNYQKEADIIYSSGIIYYQEDNLNKPYNSLYGYFTGLDMYNILYEGNVIPNLSVIMKRTWVDTIGYQSELPEIVGCEDWEYWIRLAKNGATFFGINKPLFIYRVHQMGISQNFARMRIAESWAMYLNVDFTILNKRVIKKKFRELIKPLVEILLIANRKKEAEKEMGMLYSITGNIHYGLLQWSLKNFKKIPSKYYIYLLSPGKFFKDVPGNLP